MILLTGSSGYIGSSFIEEYGEKYTIRTFSLQKNTLNNLTLNNIQTVIHLAALVHQMNGAEQTEYERINVRYTIDLAKKAKAEGVKHFIFMSSMAVYGNINTIITEDSECTPVSDYGKSKFLAELELKKLEDTSFVVSIIRPSMVYGENAPGNIGSLINLIQKVPILPFAKINNKRNFVYISNLTSLINNIIIKQKRGIFLAADDESSSFTYLIELISKNLGKKVFLIKVPFFDIFLKNFRPELYNKLYGNLEISTLKTKNELNYKNKYTLEDGIKFMIKGLNK